MDKVNSGVEAAGNRKDTRRFVGLLTGFRDTGALQLETALVLVRLDHIATRIVNANHSIV